jgi:uncharacterized Fe-S cluster-containing radical SAM superfamily enzyme
MCEELSPNAHAPPLIVVDEHSGIPLFGLDFLGILDRGTNVLEIKFTTICNLKCKYCFVSAGDYEHNFIIEESYLLKQIKKAIILKGAKDIEIHIAPYGEFLTYPSIFQLIRDLRQLPEIKTISAQSNGLLLTPQKIQELTEAGLDRINISLNSMDADQCAKLCGVSVYRLDHLLEMFDEVLKSSLDLLIAPVWFMGENDQGIMQIINYVKEKEAQGYIWPKLRLGIQNYLTYKTGRKLKKIFSREFKFFYDRLKKMEHQYGLKLKLGPVDFDIFKTQSISAPLHEGDVANIEIIKIGRWKNEYIGRFDSDWAVKILSDAPLQLGTKYNVKFIKGNLSGNLLTGIPI